MAELKQFGWVITMLYFLVPLIALAIGYKLVLRLFGIIIIPESSIGVVNKKFVLMGANTTLPDGKIIALNGEAGWQADTLAPGIHFWKFPWQFEIKIESMFVVPTGKIGIVNAKDGQPICDRILGKHVICDSFQDARKFLAAGERGPQISYIPPGTYRINTALFDVKTENATEVPSSKVGVVTTKDGLQLPSGDVAGKEIQGHNSFQNAQAFMDEGGYRGRQEQVIMASRYFINPMFAEVELIDLTEVPIAHVGVVIAFAGNEGKDVTGETFKHANLVGKGERGVWADPLDPGRYALNSYTRNVVIVSTANIVLNWANTKSESHKLDENLSSIKVRTKDGYSFTLDVSQIIHIPAKDAPKVIARFGSVANLVTQVLEPTIGNYFRNAAQHSDIISFLSERQKRQEEAKQQIAEALIAYDVVAVDTLIGDINPPEDLMKTLTDRKLAIEQSETFKQEKIAQDDRVELEKSKAMAQTQASVVTAERQVAIKDFEGQAAIKKAEGEAGAKTANAQADAKVLELVGNATAVKIRAIGTAEADVIGQKIQTMEAGNYAMVLVAEHLSKAGVPLVPETLVAGGAGDGGRGGSLVDVLLANVISQQKNDKAPKTPVAPQSAHLDNIPDAVVSESAGASEKKEVAPVEE